MQGMNFIIGEVADKLSQYIYQKQREAGWRHVTIRPQIVDTNKKNKVIIPENIPSSLKEVPELRRTLSQFESIDEIDSKLYQQLEFMFGDYVATTNDIFGSSLKTTKSIKNIESDPNIRLLARTISNSGDQIYDISKNHKQRCSSTPDQKRANRIISSTSFVLCNALAKLKEISRSGSTKRRSSSLSEFSPMAKSTNIATDSSPLDHANGSKNDSNDSSSTDSTASSSAPKTEPICNTLFRELRHFPIIPSKKLSRIRQIDSNSSDSCSTCDIKSLRRMATINKQRKERKHSKQKGSESMPKLTLEINNRIECVESKKDPLSKRPILSSVEPKKPIINRKKLNSIIQNDKFLEEWNKTYSRAMNIPSKNHRLPASFTIENNSIPISLLKSRTTIGNHQSNTTAIGDVGTSDLLHKSTNQLNIRRFAEQHEKPPKNLSPIRNELKSNPSVLPAESKITDALPRAGIRIMILWPSSCTVVRRKDSKAPGMNFPFNFSTDMNMNLPKPLGDLPMLKSLVDRKSFVGSLEDALMRSRKIYPADPNLGKKFSRSQLPELHWPHLAMRRHQISYEISIKSCRSMSNSPHDAVPPITLALNGYDGKSPNFPLPFSLKSRIMHEKKNVILDTKSSEYKNIKSVEYMGDSREREHDERDFVHLDKFGFTCDGIGTLTSLEVTPMDSAVVEGEDWYIESFSIKELNSNLKYKFNCNQWFNSRLRRFTVNRPLTPPCMRPYISQLPCALYSKIDVRPIFQNSKDKQDFDATIDDNSFGSSSQNKPLFTRLYQANELSIEDFFEESSRLLPPNWRDQICLINKKLLVTLHRKYSFCCQESRYPLVLKSWGPSDRHVNMCSAVLPENRFSPLFQRAKIQLVHCTEMEFWNEMENIDGAIESPYPHFIEMLFQDSLHSELSNFNVSEVNTLSKACIPSHDLYYSVKDSTFYNAALCYTCTKDDKTYIFIEMPDSKSTKYGNSVCSLLKFPSKTEINSFTNSQLSNSITCLIGMNLWPTCTVNSAYDLTKISIALYLTSSYLDETDRVYDLVFLYDCLIDECCSDISPFISCQLEHLNLTVRNVSLLPNEMSHLTQYVMPNYMDLSTKTSTENDVDSELSHRSESTIYITATESLMEGSLGKFDNQRESVSMHSDCGFGENFDTVSQCSFLDGLPAS